MVAKSLTTTCLNSRRVPLHYPFTASKYGVKLEDIRLDYVCGVTTCSTPDPLHQVICDLLDNKQLCKVLPDHVYCSRDMFLRSAVMKEYCRDIVLASLSQVECNTPLLQQQ